MMKRQWLYTALLTAALLWIPGVGLAKEDPGPYWVAATAQAEITPEPTEAATEATPTATPTATPDAQPLQQGATLLGDPEAPAGDLNNPTVKPTATPTPKPTASPTPKPTQSPSPVPRLEAVPKTGEELDLLYGLAVGVAVVCIAGIALVYVRRTHKDR